MPKFVATIKRTSYVDVEIEAANYDEASDKAEDIACDSLRRGEVTRLRVYEEKAEEEEDADDLESYDYEGEDFDDLEDEENENGYV